jgi:hypothetical protein
MLVMAAVGLKATARWFGWFLRKEKVPLKRSLQLFDARQVGPRYEPNRLLNGRLQPMSEEMVEGLGTEEYLQVYLTDTDKPGDDPTRVALLFVTYYTGKPDLVPHVPDECYLAGGYERIGAATVAVPVSGVGAPGDRVPVRVMQFRGQQRNPLSGGGMDVITVMYFFHTNGNYATTRNEVRASMANPFQRYAYYSKIEVTFCSPLLVRADREASVAALGPLLERVMPVLLREHFDLEKFAGGEKQVGLSWKEEGRTQDERKPMPVAELSPGRSGPFSFCVFPSALLRG